MDNMNPIYNFFGFFLLCHGKFQSTYKFKLVGITIIVVEFIFKTLCQTLILVISF